MNLNGITYIEYYILNISDTLMSESSSGLTNLFGFWDKSCRFTSFYCTTSTRMNSALNPALKRPFTRVGEKQISPRTGFSEAS